MYGIPVTTLLLSYSRRFICTFLSQQHEKVIEKEEKRIDNERKMKTIDDLDWFAKALKGNTYLLNTMLLERSPKDLPPPRRSRRSVKDNPNDEEESDHKKITKQQVKGSPDSPSDWDTSIPQQLQEAKTGDISTGDVESCSLSQDHPSVTEKTGIKRKRTRNVGGWISPDLSRLLNRSWLERESPLRHFDPSTYAPQVGECVL